MSDFELVHRPVLADMAPLGHGRLRLTPLPEGLVLQLFCPDGQAAQLAGAMSAGGLSLRANGPGQWFVVGEALPGPEALARLVAGLPQGCIATDQSHGRVRVAIEGEAVEAVLARGTGIDFARFGVGDAATTLVGHIATHLTRISVDRFELMTLRSFAESLWHDLERMGAEHLVSGNG